MTLSHKNMLFLSLKFPFLTDIEKEKFQKKTRREAENRHLITFVSQHPKCTFFHGKKQGKQKICLLHQFNP